MKLKLIYMIFGSLLLFFLVIKYGTYVLNTYCIEGFTDNNSAYSHTVNLPINDPISCKNMCGSQSKCVLTGEQCTSDIDCYGCQNMNNQRLKHDINVKPFDATGKLGLGLNYSPLTTGYNNHNINFASITDGNMVTVVKPYMGTDEWSKSFDEGLKLYNKKRESADKYGYKLEYGPTTIINEPKYPLAISATGEFYETTPPASNSTLS